MKNTIYTLSALIISIMLIIQCSTQKNISSVSSEEKNNITRDTLNKENIEKVFTFPKTLEENSALQYDNGFIWTLNDSGGENKIYKVDFKGNIVKEVALKGVSNIDWEDLAMDKDYIYISETGNNFGNRQDLKIYKIDRKEAENQSEITPQIITFDYENRTDFSKTPYNHDFDCEAIFVKDNTIHLLTKEWKSEKTTHYVLSNQAGTYKAKWLETLDVQGLITAVDVQGNQVKAVQYTRDGEVTLWNFTLDKNNFLFNNKVKATYLGNAKALGQIEGLTFFQNKLYISGEEYEGVSPNLYQIKEK